MNNEERVYSVFDYWDGPLSGVADYNGTPHYYQRQFDREQDEWADSYSLIPLDELAMKCFSEQWEIWLRWEAAHKNGETDQSTHPALPADRARDEELRQRLTVWLQDNSIKAFLVRGSFKMVGPGYNGLRASWVTQ